MKKINLLLTLLLISSIAIAQPSHYQKKVDVSGKAEMEIVPDEIFLRIALKEYKNGSRLVTLNSLEAGLVKAMKKLQLDKNDLTVDNVYGYNWNWKKKKSDEFLATKSFKLKVANVKMINDLVNELDAEGLNNIGIAEVSHSRIEEYKMNLKLEAVKNAKEKARALLSAIDEELGEALAINEMEYGGNQVYARNEMMMSAKMDGGYKSDLEFKNITIRAEVRAVFAIK